MELSKFQPLKSLDTTSYNWNCRIRLQSFWKGLNRETKEFWGLNMIFFDDSNCRIHAFASSKYCDGLLEKLEEGSIYVLSNFKVKDYVGDETYHPVRNSKHIYFTAHTHIMKDIEPGLAIEDHAFDLFHMKEIAKIADDNRFLIDIVGKVQNVRPKIVSVKNNVEKRLFKFELTDGRFSVNVTLFDDVGDQFEDDLKKCTQDPIYVVISCGKIGRYEGTPNLTNYPATRLFINPSHYSLAELKSKLETLSQVDFSTPEVVLNLQTLTVNAIKMLPPDFKEDKVNCEITVIRVDDKAGWFYNKCTKCPKEVTLEGHIYKCSDCNRIIPYPDKRFRICTICSDNTASIAVIFRDSDISRIIQKQVIDVDTQCFLEKKEEEFPSILKQFENQKYTITILIKEDNIKNGSAVYEACYIYDKMEASAKCDPSVEADIEMELISSVNLAETPHTGLSTNKSKSRKSPEVIPFDQAVDSASNPSKITKIEKI